MNLKGFLLSITLLILAYHDHAAAHVDLYDNDNYFRSNIAEYSRRFMIPIEEDGSESKNKNHNKFSNIKEYNDIANKITLENLELSLNKEMRTTKSIVHKIVSVPKKCFELAELRSYGFKRPRPRFPKARGKEDESDDKTYAVSDITKIAGLENLEQSLGTELSKANWIINKIMSIAKDCYGAEERPIEMENEDAIMNKVYEMITNKTVLLEVLQLQLGSNIHNVEDFINNTVDITKYCLDLEKSRSEKLRRSAASTHRENDGHDDALINNDIYDEIANKTTRLEILRKAYISKMKNVNSMINKTVEIAEFCFGLEAHRPEHRRKRDVSVVGKVPVAKNVTKTDANATDGRRSMYRANRERTEIQQKLLNYIYDAFNDIDTKMQALNVTKEQFANDERYAIGYIMANIDTLKVNLANIKKGVEANRDLWNDMEILEVYDTVKKSDKTLLKLHRILNLLMTKGSKIAQSI